MSNSYDILVNAVQLPKTKPTERIVTFASGTFVPNPKATQYNPWNRNRNMDKSRIRRYIKNTLFRRHWRSIN